MGKGYPMWVKDTFEYGASTQSYRARCTRHEGETGFHAEAKRQFAAQCRAAVGSAYRHDQVRVSAEKSENTLEGGILLTGSF